MLKKEFAPAVRTRCCPLPVSLSLGGCALGFLAAPREVPSQAFDREPDRSCPSRSRAWKKTTDLGIAV